MGTYPCITARNHLIILVAEGLMGERRKECDLVDILDTVVRNVREHPTAQTIVLDVPMETEDYTGTITYWVAYVWTGPKQTTEEVVQKAIVAILKKNYEEENG
jgi:hypothetical protein